ncbi:MAG: alpha-1,4-glucan--maltose-1-phosphate maltosyltransferase [Spirochaetaceae bacterium]|nr:MAG: alpha-1,4-glucan--maltose-1-phosphate maltosyltransferase [Spirochaetaceae bacterium]
MPDSTPRHGDVRVVIDTVRPNVDCGAFPIKRAVGETVLVHAHVFTDGHDHIRVQLLYRAPADADWQILAMEDRANDEWEARFPVTELGDYRYTVRAWVDHFDTWQADLVKKYQAGQNVGVQLLIGARMLEEAAARAKNAAATGPTSTSSSARGSAEGVEAAARIEKWAAQLTAAGAAASKSPGTPGSEGAGLHPEVQVAQAVELAVSEELTAAVQMWPDRSRAALFQPELRVAVDRGRALFSSWYEFFPRSAAGDGSHGTFADCRRWLPEIAEMGFDIVYFPPIHPIGVAHRKGRNNATTALADDPGSPWAIGAAEGGHTDIHPELGTLKEFRALIKEAHDLGMEIAMDMAFQCAPDHPYVKEHPAWFNWRPDGTVQYAENPPKKYQDILPLNFESDDWKGLWNELKRVVLYWAKQGIRTFRVDNPHTKPFAFWQWLIAETRSKFPDLIFLAEAFTRPKVMARLAKVGFNQSYTYFTWRTSRSELEQYITELTRSEHAEYFRPNFWPNTPDILPEQLQYGGRAAFVIRLVLAATLSSNYGVYGPAYELCEAQAVNGKEEYFNSEKYEIKQWDLSGDSLRPLMKTVNRIRRQNRSLQNTRNIELCASDNEAIIAYAKRSDDGDNHTVTVVSLDTHHRQSGWVTLPVGFLQLDHDEQYLVEDGLTGERYIWRGATNYVELDPHTMPAHIFTVRRKLRRENDFDYFL